MRLYFELDASAVRHRADEWADDGLLQSFSEYVEETVIAEGQLDPDAVSESFEGEDDPDWRCYGYLRGIDAAFRLIHPDVDTSDRGGLDGLAGRFRRWKRFNSEPKTGLLLPRFAFPDRFRTMGDEMAIEAKRDLFEYLTVVRPELVPLVTSVRIARHHSPPSTVRVEGLFVGCAPICGGGDVEIYCEPAPPRRRYHVRPLSKRVQPQLQTVIELLDASGAHIGVMPELTLDPDLVRSWKRALASTSVPPGSKLRLLLVGTGPLEQFDDGRVANRAVLLHRSGREIISQDKRHPFTLTKDMVEEWGLTPDLGEGAAAEPIAPADTLWAAEGPLGRMLILVCEDLSRTIEDGNLLLELGPSLCLAPVFSKPTLSHYWEHSQAKKLCSEIGCNTVVANSLVIEHRQRAAGIKLEGMGTALAHGPANHVSEYTDNPSGVVTLRLHPEGAFILR